MVAPVIASYCQATYFPSSQGFFYIFFGFNGLDFLLRIMVQIGPALGPENADLNGLKLFVNQKKYPFLFFERVLL